MTLRYEERRPPTGLAKSIECLWRLTGVRPASSQPHRVLPDGRIELIVHVGSRVVERRPGGQRRLQPRVHVTGQLERFLVLEPRGEVETLGIRLRPFAARTLLGIADGELTGLTIGIGQLLGDTSRRELELAAAAADPLRALGKTCSRWLGGPPPDPRLSRAVALLRRSAGGLRIGPLCGHLGLHPRTLQRRLARDFGLRPKQLARIARMEATLGVLARNDGKPLADLAQDQGFADQAHMSRELRRLTGLSPGEWRQGSHSLARQFVARP